MTSTSVAKNLNKLLNSFTPKFLTTVSNSKLRHSLGKLNGILTSYVSNHGASDYHDLIRCVDLLIMILSSKLCEESVALQSIECLITVAPIIPISSLSRITMCFLSFSNRHPNLFLHSIPPLFDSVKRDDLKPYVHASSTVLRSYISQGLTKSSHILSCFVGYDTFELGIQKPFKEKQKELSELRKEHKSIDSLKKIQHIKYSTLSSVPQVIKDHVYFLAQVYLIKFSRSLLSLINHTHSTTARDCIRDVRDKEMKIHALINIFPLSKQILEEVAQKETIVSHAALGGLKLLCQHEKKREETVKRGKTEGIVPTDSSSAYATSSSHTDSALSLLTLALPSIPGFEVVLINSIVPFSGGNRTLAVRAARICSRRGKRKSVLRMLSRQCAIGFVTHSGVFKNRYNTKLLPTESDLGISSPSMTGQTYGNCDGLFLDSRTGFQLSVDHQMLPEKSDLIPGESMAMESKSEEYHAISVRDLTSLQINGPKSASKGSKKRKRNQKTFKPKQLPSLNSSMSRLMFLSSSSPALKHLKAQSNALFSVFEEAFDEEDKTKSGKRIIMEDDRLLRSTLKTLLSEILADKDFCNRLINLIEFHPSLTPPADASPSVQKYMNWLKIVSIFVHMLLYIHRVVGTRNVEFSLTLVYCLLDILKKLPSIAFHTDLAELVDEREHWSSSPSQHSVSPRIFIMFVDIVNVCSSIIREVKLDHEKRRRETFDPFSVGMESTHSESQSEAEEEDFAFHGSSDALTALSVLLSSSSLDILWRCELLIIFPLDNKNTLFSLASPQRCDRLPLAGSCVPPIASQTGIVSYSLATITQSWLSDTLKDVCVLMGLCGEDRKVDEKKKEEEKELALKDDRLAQSKPYIDGRFFLRLQTILAGMVPELVAFPHLCDSFIRSLTYVPGKHIQQQLSEYIHEGLCVQMWETGCIGRDCLAHWLNLCEIDVIYELMKSLPLSLSEVANMQSREMSDEHCVCESGLPMYSLSYSPTRPMCVNSVKASLSLARAVLGVCEGYRDGALLNNNATGSLEADERRDDSVFLTSLQRSHPDNGKTVGESPPTIVSSTSSKQKPVETVGSSSLTPFSLHRSIIAAAVALVVFWHKFSLSPSVLMPAIDIMQRVSLRGCFSLVLGGADLTLDIMNIRERSKRYHHAEGPVVSVSRYDKLRVYLLSSLSWQGLADPFFHMIQQDNQETARSEDELAPDVNPSSMFAQFKTDGFILTGGIDIKTRDKQASKSSKIPQSASSSLQQYVLASVASCDPLRPYVFSAPWVARWHGQYEMRGVVNEVENMVRDMVLTGEEEAVPQVDTTSGQMVVARRPSMTSGASTRSIKASFLPYLSLESSTALKGEEKWKLLSLLTVIGRELWHVRKPLKASSASPSAQSSIFRGMFSEDTSFNFDTYSAWILQSLEGVFDIGQTVRGNEHDVGTTVLRKLFIEPGQLSGETALQLLRLLMVLEEQRPGVVCESFDRVVRIVQKKPVKRKTIYD
ncbi:hypothetical protein ADUPG1_011877, partial [Aduncisulcus paluster]